MISDTKKIAEKSSYNPMKNQTHTFLKPTSSLYNEIIDIYQANFKNMGNYITQWTSQHSTFVCISEVKIYGCLTFQQIDIDDIKIIDILLIAVKEENKGIRTQYNFVYGLIMMQLTSSTDLDLKNKKQ